MNTSSAVVHSWSYTPSATISDAIRVLPHYFGENTTYRLELEPDYDTSGEESVWIICELRDEKYKDPKVVMEAMNKFTREWEVLNMRDADFSVNMEYVGD